MDSFRSCSSGSSSSDASMRDLHEGENNKWNNGLQLENEYAFNQQQYARKEFNKNRKIIIRNIPPVTYDEVKQYLGHHAVSNMSISKKSRHAIVSLVHGETAEDVVNELTNKPLLDTDVTVDLYPNDSMMCVAHLPINMNNDDLYAMMKPYGAIDRCFLMYTSRGESKRYGFVEFMHNKENLEKVCGMLNGQQYEDNFLQCGFLPEKVLSFHHLNSRCLLLEKLPPSYTNHMELQNICSTNAMPIFCQIGLINGQSLGFAVVEYSASEEAELSYVQMMGCVLDEHPISVSFCMPGISGAQLVNNMISGKMFMAPLLSLAPCTPQQQPAAPHSGGLASPLVKQLLLAQSNSGSGLLDTLEEILKELRAKSAEVDINSLLNPNLQISLLSVLVAAKIQTAHPGGILGSPIIREFMSTISQQNKSDEPQGVLSNPLIAEASSMLQKLKNESANEQSSRKLDAVQNLSDTLSAINFNSTTIDQKQTEVQDTNIVKNKVPLLGEKLELTHQPAISVNKPSLLGDGEKVQKNKNAGCSKLKDNVSNVNCQWQPHKGSIRNKTLNGKEGRKEPLLDTPTSRPRQRPPLLNSPLNHKLSTDQKVVPNTSQITGAKGLQNLSESSKSNVEPNVRQMPPPLMSLTVHPPKNVNCGNKYKNLKSQITANDSEKDKTLQHAISRSSHENSSVTEESFTAISSELESLKAARVATSTPLRPGNEPLKPAVVSPSQLNPLAPQFIPTSCESSPGSKAVDPVIDVLAKNDESGLSTSLLAHMVESHIRQQLTELQSGSQPHIPPTPPSMRPYTGGQHFNSFSKTPGNKNGISDVDMCFDGMYHPAMNYPPEKKVLDFDESSYDLQSQVPVAMPNLYQVPYMDAAVPSYHPYMTPENSPPQMTPHQHQAAMFSVSPSSSGSTSSPSTVGMSPSSLQQHSSPHSLLEHTPPHYYSPTSQDSPTHILNAQPYAHQDSPPQMLAANQDSPPQIVNNPPVYVHPYRLNVDMSNQVVGCQMEILPSESQYPPLTAEHLQYPGPGGVLPQYGVNMPCPLPVKYQGNDGGQIPPSYIHPALSMNQYLYHNAAISTQYLQAVSMATAPMPPPIFYQSLASTPMPCGMDYKGLPPLPPSPENGQFQLLPPSEAFRKYRPTQGLNV